MKEIKKTTIFFILLDWSVYLGLLIIGIYFIQEAEVLQRYQLRRTNYAEYEEPISELPTIVAYFEPDYLKYGKDFNISYLVFSSGGNVQVFNLTPGENQVTEEGLIDFEELHHGTTIKITPITPPGGKNRLQGITFVFDPLKQDVVSQVTIVVKLSCENNSVSWFPNEHVDGKQLFHRFSAGITMIATLSVEKKVYMSKVCRSTPYNQLILSRLSEEVMKNCTEKCRPDINFGKSLDKFTSDLPICQTEEKAKCTNHTLSRLMETTKAEKPCTILQYTGSTQISTSGTNMADFWYRFYSQEPHVDVKEEYLILDFVAMVGSVGGTLGMCIGFSFSNCFVIVTNQFGQMIRRLKGVRVEEKADYVTKQEVNELHKVLLKSMKSQIQEIQQQIHPQMKIQCLEEKELLKLPMKFTPHQC